MDIVVACKRWGIAWAGVFLFWLAFIFAVYMPSEPHLEILPK